MLIAEVQGTRGKECSTGQRRPILQDKAEKKEYYNNIQYQRRMRESHKKSQTTKGKS
jgi:hypothetical protein